MSLPELMVGLAIMGLALGAAGLFLRPAAAPLQTGTVLVEGYFRQARMKAIAHTSAYRVRAITTDRLRLEFANTCSAVTWTASDALDLELPQDVALTSTTWSVCFTSRGISQNNVVVTLTHAEYGSRQVEVLLGGTTRVI